MSKEIKNFNNLLESFLQEDNINNFLNNHHFKIDEKTFYANLKKVFSFTNKILSNLNSDLIIVCPGKKELAYLTSIFSSFFFF